MAVAKYEVKEYEVRYECDYCGDGDMICATLCFKDGSRAYKQTTAGFIHRCDNCGHEIYLDCTYPYTETKYIRVKGEN